MKIGEYAANWGTSFAQEAFEDGGVNMTPDRLGHYASRMIPINLSFCGKHWPDLRKETQDKVTEACSKAAAARWAELTTKGEEPK